MAALAVPVEASPHPFTLNAADVAVIKQAADLLNAAAGGKKFVGTDAARAEALVERWQQADGGDEKTLLVDGWESLALGFTATRAGGQDQLALAAKLEALWQRWLDARDAHLEEQPTAVRKLRYLMSDITEIVISASWVDGTPYLCWNLAEGTARERDREQLSDEMVQELRELREQAGGWWVWPSVDFLGSDWMAPEMLFVPIEEWLEHLGREDGRSQVADLLRWTQEAFPGVDVPDLDSLYPVA